MSQPVQRCDNCLKEFPQSKIATHFGYCRRNIKRCQKCKEMYDVNYKEQHEQQFHKKTPCEFCKKQFAVAELDKHKISCSRLTKFCEYCQLNVPMNQYVTHLKACQSRTKKCQKCQKSVTNKDYFIHIATCQGFVEPPKQPKSYNQYIKDHREKESREETRPQIKNYNYVQEPKNQYDKRKQIFSNNPGKYDQARDHKSPISNPNQNPINYRNANQNMRAQDYRQVNPNQGSYKNIITTNNNPKYQVPNPKMEVPKYQIPKKQEVPKTEVYTNPKSSNNINYPTSINPNYPNYPHSIRSNPQNIVTNVYANNQPSSNQQKDPRNIYSGKQQIKQPEIKTYEPRKAEEPRNYYKDKAGQYGRKEQQPSNKQGVSPHNLPNNQNNQNIKNKIQSNKYEPNKYDYKNEPNKYEPNKYDYKNEPNKYDKYDVNKNKPAQYNPKKYEMPAKKPEKKQFDPTEYGGYTDEIPPQFLTGQSAEQQRIIIQSMKINKIKSDPKKKVLKQFEALNNMDKPFNKEQYDEMQQRAIYQDIVKKNAKRR